VNFFEAQHAEDEHIRERIDHLTGGN